MAEASPAGPALAIAVEGLTKDFKVGFLHRGRRQALKNITFDVRVGEIFGYLGPNGSGKTTTLKVIMGLLFPEAGTVTVLGHPLADRAWRYRAGYLPEQPYFYDYLSPREYLDYSGRLAGVPKATLRERMKALLEKVKLSHVADIPMRRFSKGMLQRLGLAQALINDPDLIFLDEPMSGLDPLGRRAVRDLILDLKQQGKTVLFSTHILSDAETLCDRVAVLRDGEVLSVGALSDILKVDVAHMEVVVSGLPTAALEGISGVKVRQALGERFRLEVEEARLADTVAAIQKAGGRVLGIQAIRDSLEDYFFREMNTDTRRTPWMVAD
jgi:ABC-2 type transport system ATP-binding protein